MHQAQILTLPRLLFALLALAPIAGYAQQRLSMRTIGMTDGLSQTQINALLQDRQGFLWIATNDGLNRYDGYHIRVFRSEPGKPGALTYNVVSYLLEGRDGQFWVATDGGGLLRYHRKTEKFEAIIGLADPAVETLYETSSGMLWVGMNHGNLQLLDPSTLQLTRYDPRLEDWAEKQHQINDLLEDRSGRTYVATNWGLYRTAPNRGPLEPIPVDPNDPTQLDNGYVASMLEHADGSIWVGTGFGLQRLDPISLRVRRYELHRHQSSYDPIYDLLEQEGWLWIARNSGLYRIRIDRDPASASAEDRVQGPPRFVSCLLTDRTGLVWAGVSGLGLTAFDPKRPFNFLGTDRAQETQSLFTYALLEARDGALWIGHTEGLSRWHPKTRRLEHQDLAAQLANEADHNVWSLAQTEDDRIWAGTNHGLYRLDGTAWQRAPIAPQARDPNTHNYTSLCVSQDFERPTLWAGTLAGLQRIDRDTMTLQALYRHRNKRNSLPHDAVRVLLETTTPKGRMLWVGTEGGGLARLNPRTGIFQNYACVPGDTGTLSDQRVISLYMQNQDTLWIGTRGGGLNRLTLGDGRFTVYRSAQGLANDTVYAILPDLAGNLWLSTNLGLSRFDPKKQRFRNYTVEDGLQGNEFNTGAYCRGRDGRLYFGGTNGMTYFDPALIRENPLPPPLAFTRFQLFDQTLAPSDPARPSPLPQAIDQTSSLTLQADQNVFSIEFAALDFIAPSKNRYRHQLEGFDREPLETDATNRLATYTNLDPGVYRFRAWASNSDGAWNERGSELEIRVMPPAWKSAWAFLFYTLTLLTLVMAYLTWQQRIRQRLERIVTRRTQELSKKNLELDAGYRELVTLDRIIQVINAEVELQDVALALLEQGRALFPDFHGGLFLLREDEGSPFAIIAATGHWRTEPPKPPDPTELRALFGEAASRSEPGIEVFSPFHGFGGSYPSLVMLKSFHEGRLRGLLLFTSSRSSGLGDADRLKLERFRQHMVVAVTRARIMEDLLRAQQDLVSAAHSAGMAQNAATVLHDFGNAFNGIQTNAQLLDSALRNSTWAEQGQRLVQVLERMADGELSTDEKRLRLAAAFAERALRGVASETEQMLRFCIEIQDNLTRLHLLMRRQQGQTEAAKLTTEMHLNQLVQEVVDAERMRRNHDIKLSFQPSLLPLMRLDRAKLRMALLCVLENAYEAIETARGRRGGNVLLQTYEEGDHVVLEIADDGPGIPQSAHELVFRQGYSTKPSSCGLGLHFAANTLAELGGHIELGEPRYAQGATIRFLFPQD